MFHFHPTFTKSHARVNGITEVTKPTKQKGQVIPTLLLSLGLTGGLGITASPILLDFIDKAEHASITHARSSLNTSLNTNHLLSTLNSNPNFISINGEKVRLQFGYPEAKSTELEKMASFGTQTLVNNPNNTVTIWSTYKSYCFIYRAAQFDHNKTNPANLSEVSPQTNPICPSLDTNLM